MISLNVRSYCDTCKEFEPVVERLYENGRVIMQCVTCAHIERCDSIAFHIIEHEKENDEK